MKRALGFLVRYLYAGVSCAYLFSLGILKSKNREFIGEIAGHFGYSGSRPALPKTLLRELVSDSGCIELRQPMAVDGNVTLLELVSIAKLVRACQPGRLLEIGTFNGRTTLNLAANSPADAHVYTLDLPKSGMEATELPLAAYERSYINKETSGASYRGTDCEKKISQLYGDSATFDFSDLLGTIDFVFVDGSHSYEYVLKDSQTALKLTAGKNRSVILWHDYGVWEGVTRALDELHGTDEKFAGLRHIQGTTLVCLQTGGAAPAG